jgi:hypothetical protein
MTGRHERELPLDQPAELAGDWWLPSAREQLAHGRLIYSATDGLALDVTRGGGVFDVNVPAPWINGQTVDGRNVTLRDSFVTSFSQSMPGGERAKLHVDRAFVGLDASADRELRFVSLSARMTNLREWLAIGGLTVRTGLGSPHINYAPHSPVGLGRTGGTLVTAAFDTRVDAQPQRTPFTLSLEERAWIELQPRRGRTFDDLRTTLDRMHGFLSFATAADCAYLEIVALARVRVHEFAPGGPRFSHWSTVPVWVLEQPVVLPHQPRPRERMLFTFDDLLKRDLKPLHRWLRRAELFAPVMNLYLSALPSKELRLEYRFLAFAHALEGYHRRKHPRRLDYQKRLEALVDELPAEIRRWVPDRFAELTKDTRNYFSHWEPKLESKAARGEELVSLTFAVKLLFELTMALELGFSKTEVQAWVLERNQRLVWEMRRSFVSL